MCATVVPLLTYDKLYPLNGPPIQGRLKKMKGLEPHPCIVYLVGITVFLCHSRCNEVCQLHSWLCGFRSALRLGCAQEIPKTDHCSTLRSCHCVFGGVNLDLLGELRSRDSLKLKERFTETETTYGSKLGRARGQRVVIGGVALKSLNMYGNVAFVRHKIACCVARSHACIDCMHIGV